MKQDALPESAPKPAEPKPAEPQSAQPNADVRKSGGAGEFGLTAFLPCYNEEDHIDAAYAAIVAELGSIPGFELLIVDDGSVDGTLARIRAIAATDPRVRYLSFTRNFGLEAAQQAGFRHAGAPWLVQLDADLQSPPAQTWRLLEAAAEGGYDVVFAIREFRRDPAFRRLGSWLMHVVARVLMGVNVPPGASVFRVMRTSVARTMADLRLGTPYTIATVPMVGAKYGRLVTAHSRRDGRSRWKLSRLIGHAFELFFGYSWRPLNASNLVGSVGVLIATVLAVLALAQLVPDIIAVGIGLLILAVLLAANVITGRYLQLLMKETTKMPAYFVAEANFDIPGRFRLDGGAPPIAPPTRKSVAALMDANA